MKVVVQHLIELDQDIGSAGECIHSLRQILGRQQNLIFFLIFLLTIFFFVWQEESSQFVCLYFNLLAPKLSAQLIQGCQFVQIVRRDLI